MKHILIVFTLALSIPAAASAGSIPPDSEHESCGR